MCASCRNLASKRDLALFMINLASKKCKVWIFKNSVFICFNPSTKILWPPAQNMVWAFKIVLHSTFFILQVFIFEVLPQTVWCKAGIAKNNSIEPPIFITNSDISDLLGNGFYFTESNPKECLRKYLSFFLKHYCHSIINEKIL